MSKELNVKNPKTVAFILMAGTFIGVFSETALNMALTNIMEQYSILAFMVLFFGLTMVTMPSQTNALNQLPREFYGDGSAAMNTLNQVAGAAGTAIAITLFTSGQASHIAAFPNATEPVVLAAGIKYTFYFITGISVLALILSFFTRKTSKVKQANTNTVTTEAAEK